MLHALFSPVKCHEMPMFPGNFLTFPRYHDPVAMFHKPPRTLLRPMVQIFLPPDYSCSVLGNGTADPGNESDLFVSCRKKCVGSDFWLVGSVVYCYCKAIFCFVYGVLMGCENDATMVLWWRFTWVWRILARFDWLNGVNLDEGFNQQHGFTA